MAAITAALTKSWSFKLSRKTWATASRALSEGNWAVVNMKNGDFATAAEGAEDNRRAPKMDRNHLTLSFVTHIETPCLVLRLCDNRNVVG
jgi:hypothetical protein